MLGGNEMLKARARDLARPISLAQVFATVAMAQLAFGCLTLAARADDSTPPKIVGDLIATAPDESSLKWAPCPDVFPKGCEVTILSGDPAKGISDVYLRTPPNMELQKHWHHSPEHVVLVKGKFSVTFEDGRKAKLDQGAYTYIPAGMPHSARCEGPEPCAIFIGFEKPVDAIKAAAK
jgi:quercetin dioxygenase-like cupin family protein